MLSLGETHLECWAQCWAPQYKPDMDNTEESPVNENKVNQGTGAPVIQGEVETWDWRREGSGEILSMCINTRWEGITRTKTEFSLSSDRTRGNGHKLEYKNCFLNIKKKNNFLTVRAFKHWPREHVESPSLETFKTQLDMALN